MTAGVGGSCRQWADEGRLKTDGSQSSREREAERGGSTEEESVFCKDGYRDW